MKKLFFILTLLVLTTIMACKQDDDVPPNNQNNNTNHYTSDTGYLTAVKVSKLYGSSSYYLQVADFRFKFGSHGEVDTTFPNVNKDTTLYFTINPVPIRVNGTDYKIQTYFNGSVPYDGTWVYYDELTGGTLLNPCTGSNCHRPDSMYLASAYSAGMPQIHLYFQWH